MPIDPNNEATVERVARVLCVERNCDPRTLCQHHEWEDWPTDHKDDRGRLYHYGWRRYTKTARAVLAELSSPLQRGEDQ